MWSLMASCWQKQTQLFSAWWIHHLCMDDNKANFCGVTGFIREVIITNLKISWMQKHTKNSHFLGNFFQQDKRRAFQAGFQMKHLCDFRIYCLIKIHIIMNFWSSSKFLTFRTLIWINTSKQRCTGQTKRKKKKRLQRLKQEDICYQRTHR